MIGLPNTVLPCGVWPCRPAGLLKGMKYRLDTRGKGRSCIPYHTMIHIYNTIMSGCVEGRAKLTEGWILQWNIATRGYCIITWDKNNSNAFYTSGIWKIHTLKLSVWTKWFSVGFSCGLVHIYFIHFETMEIFSLALNWPTSRHFGCCNLEFGTNWYKLTKIRELIGFFS